MSTDEASVPRMGGLTPIKSTRPPLSLPVAALLFAPASVLAYMSGGVTETSISDAIPALVGSVIFALLVWAAVIALRRRADATTALIACLWVTVCVYYVSLFDGLNTSIGGGRSLAATLPFALAILVLATVAIRRLRGLSAPIHTVLSVIALVMLATPLWQIVTYAVRQGDAHRIYDADAAARQMPELEPAAPAAQGTVRPTYTISSSTASHRPTYWNGTTIWSRCLMTISRSRGFYVATDSHSNYLKTGHSLASTFYMDYLDFLSTDPRDRRQQLAPDLCDAR